MELLKLFEAPQQFVCTVFPPCTGACSYPVRSFSKRGFVLEPVANRSPARHVRRLSSFTVCHCLQVHEIQLLPQHV